MRQKMILAAAAALCLMLVTSLAVAVASAAPAEAKPVPKVGHGKPARITWTPAVVTSTQPLAPGESFTTTVTFTATQTISNARLVVRGAGTAVNISPKSFDSINAGQTYTVSVSIKAPTKGHKGGIAATLQLREGHRVLAKPLHIRWKPTAR